MPRSSRSQPALRTASIDNTSLITQCIVDLNMTDAGANDSIFELLLKQSRNLDCIIDDDERSSVAESMGFAYPTEAERVGYVRDQIGRSSNKKGKAEWSSMIDGDSLIDRGKYHKIRAQRLREQIRQVRRNIETAYKKAEAVSNAQAGNGLQTPQRWDSAESIPIERFNTWEASFDEFFGTTTEEITMTDGEVREVTTSGIPRGFSILFGAPGGMGKTRWCCRLLKSICGPRTKRDDGVEYGGLRGLYIQGEETMPRFKSLFLDGIWEPGMVNVEFAEVSLLADIESMISDMEEKPDVIIIDSKDMIHEFNGSEAQIKSGFKRFNALLDRYGITAIIISHVNKSGGLKGSTSYTHMPRAVMLGELDDHDKSVFRIRMDKNRGGPKHVETRWRHGENGVELDGHNVARKMAAPDLERADGDQNMNLDTFLSAALGTEGVPTE